ncbi:MAG: electron transfer flavoprotein subunit alpha [Chthonomonadaceae bacterium]|uniref:Electron transfer flavoprotein subunit alpha n=1 Tax=Candidatus Nitrosymbiomonas proteolyticus TaxID=2608984 RepID=A0A809RVZ1_9BACT|nr:electron transfer flavoprotein subunit alpha [Candidatus Nitrosymbiomonas proteolyticus]
MSKMLGICWTSADAAPLAALANSLGAELELLYLGCLADTSVGAQGVIEATGSLPPADALAPFVAGFAEGRSFLAAVSSMAAKDVLPRVAARVGGVMVTDAVAVKSPQMFVRPIVAGSLLETVEVSGEPIVLTIRPAGFSFSSTEGAPAAKATATLPGVLKAKKLAVAESKGGRPDLTQAKVVVSGGRPLKDAETFEKLIGGLADALGGAIGATRAAVDSGIAPNELQVGQTGKIVAPDLYIAAGISGSTQHLAGMKESKVIVAINTDPDAPMMAAADFALCMDLFEAIPQLIDALKP